MWVGVVTLAIIAALGLWWIMATRPFNASTDIADKNNEQATTTVATSTDATGSKTPVSRVNRSSDDVASIVASLSGASTFQSLFRSTGVASSISASGKYTIFVPTDGAVSQLKSGTITGLSAAEKKRLVQYHVVAGRAIDVDALVAGQIQALSGDPLNFSFGANQIPMVNSAITITQYNGKNGTVYLIDNVLIPPTKNPAQ